MKNYLDILQKGSAVMAFVTIFTSCSDSFLKQDPLSFYEPSATYANEAGLQAAMAMCDKHLKDIILDGNGNVVPMATNYLMSDIGLYAKTDAGGGFQDNFDGKITPTSGMSDGGDANAMQRFWSQGYTGIKYANTVLSYVDKVATLNDKTRDEYKGRAYFHRAYKYYHLVLQFGDIPLVTKIISVPKQNYKTTTKEAIFKMLVSDLEFAVEKVPSQRDMLYVGMVNKEACMHLLAKCYLVIGEYSKAEQMATKLIEEQGLRLMTEPFGTFIKSGNDNTWKVERNVLWDLHRGDNVCSPANKEMIMPILNFNAQNLTGYPVMRAIGVHWSNGVIRDPSGLSAPTSNYARNNGKYNTNLDWLRVLGRGIGCFRTSYHYNARIWNVDGASDGEDLRHNRKIGNWVEMEDIRYNNPSSPFYDKPMQLYATKNYVDPKSGIVTVHAGDLLCGDTIRSWYPIPLYKNYVLDQTAENNMGANQFNGVSTGSNGNMYLFRLAETYLIRAEAKFYQGNSAGAASDVNAVRSRAKARHMFENVTIGDIVDERARELFFEEWRQAELVRVSWCLAKSGKADEWGNTYDLKNWDKQEGVDKSGGSYWFRRLTTYSLFNKGVIQSNGTSFNFQVNKHNLFWPIPNSAITANNGARLQQNFGYDGYDASIEMWSSWEDAVADEDKTK